jgi:hypothetical protein
MDKIAPTTCLILTIVLLLLQCFGVINWAWYWLFAPLWIPAGLTLLMVFIILFVNFADDI